MFRAIFPSKTPFLRSLSQTRFFFSYSALSSSLPTTSTPIFLKTPITNPSLSNPTFTPNSILFSPFSSQTSRQKKAKEEYYDDSDGEFVVNRDPKSPPKLFVVQPRLRPDTLLKAKLDEAVNLANSLEEQRDGYAAGDDLGERKMPPHLVVQNPAATKAHADTYFGQGTVETVKSHLNAAETEDGMDAVFVNAILSGIQQRNLERAWGKAVLDRVGLIIEIFNAHAQTKEAKLQAELAALMYRKTRLVRLRGPDGRLTFGVAGEAAEVVSARGRGSGGRGFISGAGETELQLQRRRILERRNHLLAQIEEVRRTRALQRAARKRRGGSHGQGLATVAVVGYTNAGKSTLISALSDSDLYSDDRLFATVDPRLRSVILPSGKKVLLSDTVGFISDLPVQLVEAFHATLEEIVEADLLVHVLDASAFNLEEQRSAVIQVLQQIGVSEEKLQNMIEVWNKIDLLRMEQDEESNFSEAEEHEMVSEALAGEPLEDHTTSELFAAGDEVDKEVEQSESSEDIVIKGENMPNQPQDIQRVETSALMGVGLQELLSLIDEKLNAQKNFENRIFDRKWRPPCTADMNTAVEQ